MLFLLLALLAVLPASPEQQVRKLLEVPTAIVMLPPGRIEVHRELKIPDGTHDLMISGGQNTILSAAADFSGKAILSCKSCQNLSIRNLTIDGNRTVLEKPLAMAPADVPFSRFFLNNGILIEDSARFRLDHVDFTNMASFAVIVSHSSGVSIENVKVSSSGSRTLKGRNNTSGGILLEQGTTDFVVTDCALRDIRGNGVWTHSCYRSPRNVRGRITHNDFTGIGRDAIQVGHASEVAVAQNTVRRVGLQPQEVDMEGGGTPVGIDTAGDVDKSIYESNRMEEIDGKCIDLDGFHDGTVRGNTCINRGRPEDYPYGNFGISLNNTSVEMQSRNILIEGNRLDGMKFGGIFVIGSGHRILHNTMRRLNTAHCNDTHVRFGCLVLAGEPGFLESGIYLAARAGKPDPARGLRIEDNIISGWKMAKYCIRVAPGVALGDNDIKRNHCSNE